MKYAFYPGCTWSSAAGYRESVHAVNAKLGIVLDEIEDWNCCGATVAFSVDEMSGLLAGSRVMALAEKAGYDHVVTGCNACYTTLRKVQKKCLENTNDLEAVNRRLADEGLTFDPGIDIRHHLEILVNDIDESLWAELAGNQNSHIKVAPYYGCQLTRPWNDIEPSDILERLITLSGFSVAEHSAKTLCCGGALAVPYEKETRPLISRIVRGMTMNGADLMTTTCPLCQLNMDQGQMGKGTGLQKLPVTYYSQIAGLGLGVPRQELGLSKLLIRLNKGLKVIHE